MQQNTKYIKEQRLPTNSLPNKWKFKKKKKNLDMSNAKENIKTANAKHMEN